MKRLQTVADLTMISLQDTRLGTQYSVVDAGQRSAQASRILIVDPLNDFHEGLERLAVDPQETLTKLRQDTEEIAEQTSATSSSMPASCSASPR